MQAVRSSRQLSTEVLCMSAWFLGSSIPWFLRSSVRGGIVTCVSGQLGYDTKVDRIHDTWQQ